MYWSETLSKLQNTIDPDQLRQGIHIIHFDTLYESSLYIVLRPCHPLNLYKLYNLKTLGHLLILGIVQFYSYCYIILDQRGNC